MEKKTPEQLKLIQNWIRGGYTEIHSDGEWIWTKNNGLSYWLKDFLSTFLYKGKEEAHRQLKTMGYNSKYFFDFDPDTGECFSGQED